MDGKYLTKNNEAIYLRTAIQGDRAAIHDIDIKSYERPWTPKEYQARRDYTRVAIVQNRVVGFWVATLDEILDEEYISLIKLAVTPSYRRQGIGTVLLEDVLFNYNNLSCVTAILDIQEEAQFFLKSNGFQFVKKLNDVKIGGFGNVSCYYFRKDNAHSCSD